MKQPVLLCYNLSGEKMQKIRLAAMRLKIRVRPVEKDEYAQTVAALCGLEEETDAAYVGAGFEDEMLVMANFPAGMMNRKKINRKHEVKEGNPRTSGSWRGMGQSPIVSPLKP